jgi:hypothetical protein
VNFSDCAFVRDTRKLSFVIQIGTDHMSKPGLQHVDNFFSSRASISMLVDNCVGWVVSMRRRGKELGTGEI